MRQRSDGRQVRVAGPSHRHDSREHSAHGMVTPVRFTSRRIDGFGELMYGELLQNGRGDAVCAPYRRPDQRGGRRITALHDFLQSCSVMPPDSGRSL